MAEPGRSAREDPHRRPAEHVERTADQGARRIPTTTRRAPYPDHVYLYTGRVNSFHYAATRPLQWPPGTVGRYRNTDPVLINYLVRLAVEKRGEDYLSFPQRALFDKIGIRTMVMETDPFGNFLTQGYELTSGRDWARLGNLYLQDGVVERRADSARGIRQVREHAGAGVGGRRAAGLRRLLLDQRRRRVPGAEGGVLHGGRRRPDHADHSLARPRRGAASDTTKGSTVGSTGLNTALALLMEAVPKRQ